jgi:hypothetical protein
MVEEALLRIELSPDVDEVWEFDPGNVCSIESRVIE